MVDEQPEECATDDATGEEAAETEEVTTPQCCRLLWFWHRPKLPQDAALNCPGQGPGKESRIAVVNIGGRSVSMGGHRAVRVTPTNARERYHERPPALKWIDQCRSDGFTARAPWAGWPGADTFGSRKVSASVTTTIAATPPHIQGPV